jgi:hypothetical protein
MTSEQGESHNISQRTVELHSAKSRSLVWVKLRKTQCEQMSSGLPLKADLAQCSWHFAFVPGSEVAIHGSSLRAKAIRPAQHDFAALFRDPSQGG